MRGSQVLVTEQSFPCPLCPVAFVLHHMRARVIYATFLAGGGGQYLDPQPRPVPYQPVAPISLHCSFPPFPLIVILGAWQRALGPPRGSRQNVAPPSCFDRPGPKPILRPGGGGEHTSDRTTMRKSAGRHVGKLAGWQVGRSTSVAAVGKLVSRQFGRSAGPQGGRSAGRPVGSSAGRQVGRSAGRQVGRSAGGQVDRAARERVGRSAGWHVSRSASRQASRLTSR